MLRRSTSPYPRPRGPLARPVLIATTLALSAVLAAPGSASAEMDITDAVWLTGHSYGETVEDADILAALDRIGRNGGSTVEEEDRQRLLGWANGLWEVRQTALDQVGDPYYYGGSGPDSFDCSGLTSFAWRAVGVELPHNSGAQASATTSIARHEVRVGDLVFYGSPIHHVAMYIGDGKVVEAPSWGKSVRVTAEGWHRGDIVGYGRVSY